MPLTRGSIPLPFPPGQSLRKAPFKSQWYLPCTPLLPNPISLRPVLLLWITLGCSPHNKPGPPRAQPPSNSFFQPWTFHCPLPVSPETLLSFSVVCFVEPPKCFCVFLSRWEPHRRVANWQPPFCLRWNYAPPIVFCSSDLSVYNLPASKVFSFSTCGRSQIKGLPL